MQLLTLQNAPNALNLTFSVLLYQLEIVITTQCSDYYIVSV